MGIVSALGRLPPGASDGGRALVVEVTMGNSGNGRRAMAVEVTVTSSNTGNGGTARVVEVLGYELLRLPL